VAFYVVAYILMNAAAFGLILLLDRGGRFDEGVDGLRGLAQRAPLAAASVLVVLLALTGIPPTAGFVGKYLLFTAAVERGMILLAAAGALNSVVSLFYYFRIGRAMFLEDEAAPLSPTGPAAPARVSRSVTVVLAFCAAALLLFGILPGLLTTPAATAVLGR
jgi:NADH-quinone oxidoreductase subunit N